MGELKVSCSGMMDKALVSRLSWVRTQHSGKLYTEAQDIIGMKLKPVSITTLNICGVGRDLQLLFLIYIML